MFKKLLVLLAALVATVPVAAQTTFVYPALSTNNAFTGTNSFGAATTFNSNIYIPGLANSPCLGTGAGGIMQTESCQPALGYTPLNPANNLGDVANPQTAINNLVTGHSILPAILNADIFTCPPGSNAATCIATAQAYAVSGHAVTILFGDAPYNITTPITLSSGIKLLGVLPRLVDCTANFDPCQSPNGGTWFNCSTACFNTAGTGTTYPTAYGVNGIGFEDLGLENWTGTAITFGSPTTVGLSTGYFHNVFFYGTPGSGVGNTGNGPSDKGLVCYNCQLVPGDNVSIMNVNTGVAFLTAGATGSVPGNAVWTGLTVQTYRKSVVNGNNTEPGIDIESNLMTFIRPQVNTYGGDSTCDGILLAGDGFGITLLGVDGEAECKNMVDIYTGNNFIDIPEAYYYIVQPNTVYIESGATNNIFQSENTYATALNAENLPNDGNFFNGSWRNNAGELVTLTIHVAGTGWANNDTFTISGGTGGIGKIVTESGGIPSAIAIVNVGNGYSAVTAASTTAVGPSTGTGLTVTTTVVGATILNGENNSLDGNADFLGNVLVAQTIRQLPGSATLSLLLNPGSYISFGPSYTSGSLDFNPAFGLYPFVDNVSQLGIGGNAWSAVSSHLYKNGSGTPILPAQLTGYAGFLSGDVNVQLSDSSYVYHYYPKFDGGGGLTVGLPAVGAGVDLMTGPATSTTGDCAKFSDALGTIADSGVTCAGSDAAVVGSTSTVATLSGATYFGVVGSVNGALGTVSVASPNAATVKNLFVKIGTALTSGTFAVTLYDNGSPTAVTCTVTYPATTCSDTTHTATIAQGDLIAYQGNASASTNTVPVAITLVW